MTKRLLVGIGVALAFAGTSLAQPAADVRPTAPPSFNHVLATERIDDVSDDSPPRLWATADYLIAWMTGTSLPPLVTTSPAGTARVSAGVLGVPTTSVLVGGRVNDEARSGGRFTAGVWLDPDRHLGIEGGFSMLESQSTIFLNSSDGTSILARPFFNPLLQAPASVLVAFPGSSSGAIGVQASSGNFYDLHLDVTECFLDESWIQVSSLFGYRFLRYDDALRIQQVVVPTAPPVPGTQIQSIDNFSAHNEFHGGDLGVRAQVFWRTLSLDMLGKLAVGRMNRGVDISGGQSVLVPGAAAINQAGGVAALISNIGIFPTREWTVLPEIGATLGWQARSNLRLRLGYSALFLNDIARADDHLDLVLNPNLFPPAAINPTATDRPFFNPNRAALTIHSISIGAEFTY